MTTIIESILDRTKSSIIEAANDAEFDIDYKGIFTITKALWTAFGIYRAMGIWNDSKSSLSGPAVRLMCFNAVLVALVTAYKLTRREIAPLFVLQCLGHYSCFLVCAALAGYGSHPRIKKGKKVGDRRIGLAIWTLHALYAVVLVVGYQYAACEEGNVYPISFVMSDSLFLVSYVMLLYVKKRGFDIDDLKDDEDEDEDFSSTSCCILQSAVEASVGIKMMFWREPGEYMLLFVTLIRHSCHYYSPTFFVLLIHVSI